MLLMVYIFIGCESQYDFEDDGQGADQYILNGTIDNSGGPYFISLERTVQGLGAYPNGVANACIEIVDENGNREKCKHEQNGIYKCAGEIVVGVPGQAFKVEVAIDNVFFESLMDTMPDTTMPQYGISWEQGKLTETSVLGIDIETDVVFVHLDVDVPASDNKIYLNWVGEEIYQFLQKEQIDSQIPPCYVVSNYGGANVRILSNEKFAGNYRLDNALFRIIDDSFLRKHLISIFQYSVSRPYYEYLARIKILVENNGSLFDPPPGRANGNFLTNQPSSEVNGYFRSVLVDTATVAIYPSQLEGILIQDRCVLYFSIERCFGCPNAGKYSGFERPEYYHRIL